MRKYVVGEHLAYLICSNPSATVPSFLVPTFFPRTIFELQKDRPTICQHATIRHFTTATAKPHRQDDGAVYKAEKERLARRAMSKILQSPSKSNKRPWTSLLEQYLPQHLQKRQGERSQGADSTITGPKKPVPVQDLHIWLAEARKVKESKGDLLTYLAVDEERQDAVIWLVNEVLKEHVSSSQTGQSPFSPCPGISRRHLPGSLEDFTRSADTTHHAIEATAHSGTSLDHLSQRAGRSATRECLGEIWRSIGSMILQAADREPTSAKSKSIMTCVHRILHHLHHASAIPSSIFNYDPAKDPSVLQRPPTIYYWSNRIMAAISEAHWASIDPSNDPSNGNRLPRDAMSSIMVEVEPQIWLDYVLWCCVEGGWITEAAEIVYEMWTRKGERQYSVIDYNTLSQQHAPKLSWTARIKASIRKSRMRETVGGDTFGSYSDRIDYLKPPERHVSSEVVAAIIDGLVDTASPRPELFGNKHSLVEKHISVCKIMLNRKQLGLGSNSWDSVILRIFQSLSAGRKLPPTILEPIISWSPPFLQEPFATNSAYHSDSRAQAYVADPSALSLGLLYRLLSDFARLGDFRGALRIFRRLQEIVDTNRRISLNSFPAMVTPVLQQDGEDALIGNGEQQEAPGLNLQLPSHILVPFLDLITDAQEFELGNWLLYSDDVDGCIIPPAMYSDAVLQPSLIRFASAAGDEGLLNRVTEQLKAPISEGVLRALLHHRIQDADWHAAHEILELLRDGEGLAWDPTDVIALANAAMRAERRPSDVLPEDANALSPAGLLIALLGGRYNTTYDASMPRDLSERRMLNQLARIIASIPSQLRQDLLPFCDRESNQLSPSWGVPTRAFNMLLASAVELFGVFQGKRLCENWCFLPGAASLQGLSVNSGAEQVVQPNIQTFYTILRPLSQANIDAGNVEDESRIRHSNDVEENNTLGNEQTFDGASNLRGRRWTTDGEQNVVEWGIARCLELGLRWKDIKQDLPGLAAVGKNSSLTHTIRNTGIDSAADSEPGPVLDSEIG
ncbi:MAG: hypothetical protein Q9225_002199 [Loekoesia sp. 1 TL-2023]